MEGHLSCNHSKQIFGSISLGDESPNSSIAKLIVKRQSETSQEEAPALGSGS